MNTFAVEYSYKTLLIYFEVNGKALSLVTDKDKINYNLSIPKIFSDFVLENGINLNQVDLLINSSGPGSFTGLRISLSFIKGLSLGLSIPFVSIPTFDVFARLVCASSDILTLSFTAGKYFLGYYRESKLCGSVFCFSESELFEYLDKLDSKLVIVGNGIELIYEKLKNKFEIVSDIGSFGKVLTELGKLKYLESKQGDSILSGPLYLRMSDAEINSYLMK
ncbi:tRNA (adenosine(37)-N6)-threonylcarbamoyltransferase complex dimerization subunit type 1 TsaB [Candidatus Borreliella tachyglossi]|uniref:tRNA (Adenosine(37)-N6)-threonylcarbamoyltransferase complex dimerization subunit type 1 TsaB n=1 Tax=Candidatus Borreliella tachyglossi TaxID=1964448 RepID=A0A2S1LWD5_9SPIR|nr:tRNA (adenosine(37)-N6)-threonylcarbamoyltransferase complex dimerization subunit type 1 TsaB [Candidatus Borreliella tachyglossi]AWG42575.1 tRNA (adenosine(37)-N6)-threonylcarbamoyltransferase complex dimerization subunit type 1 TsaB [Candidatus Borreliella tachyglossi]